MMFATIDWVEKHDPKIKVTPELINKLRGSHDL